MSLCLLPEEDFEAQAKEEVSIGSPHSLPQWLWRKLPQMLEQKKKEWSGLRLQRLLCKLRLRGCVHTSWSVAQGRAPLFKHRTWMDRRGPFPGLHRPLSFLLPSVPDLSAEHLF